ncbi:molybdopterin molybdotransferase [Altererythrobacter atlanticus]|uniref:Molybdopterin molybdenumtransferase n=1 Tax=Croceibacterium atlanticum TaxID=1267766 RepID=A0A0F7KR49_9SPHN|nr:molybdopterin molybdotransferase MoeA [Croceibacterium atlanticum]AKH41662.1 Molybdopterin molybdenumtransferase [Croceibacterium atlanticum]MBB5733126.1 molybdopterin molybdotransferase [Croceibacterium atlanticum]
MTLPQPIPLEEAQQRLLAGVEPLPGETLPVSDALGRYLAEPLVALRQQPASNLSAMDGYAMRADDLAGPWTVVGESAAGHPFGAPLEHGQAIRISTGALMPENGGAILLQEEAERQGNGLALAPNGEATPRHIRRAGFDFRQGAELFRAGIRIGPAQLALAISGGHANIPVSRLPRVAVLDSGDELSADPRDCAIHQIPASNGAMIAAMAAPFACAIDRIGPVADNMAALSAALAEADHADVLVTSGGASVGDHDLVRPALEAWGADIHFWRVAMKPGKPLLVARRGRQFVLGLPGNPVSSFVTAYLFLLPLLRKLAGAADPVPAPFRLWLAGDLPPTGSRLEFVRGFTDGETIGAVSEQDSSALAALSRANALIRREVNSPPAHAGEMVTAYLLQNGGIA